MEARRHGSAPPTPLGRLPALGCCLLFLLLGSDGAHGAPPANPDPALSGWFHSLRQPGTGASCCDLSDCRPVQVRTGADGYEALITPASFPVVEPRWVLVPADKILQGKDNPIGEPVVCWTPSRGVLCFVQGAGS